MKKYLLIAASLLLMTQNISTAREDYSMLKTIKTPQDVKSLNTSQMDELAKEIRSGVLNHSNKIGGHVAPDLGIVEATIALHYVFNSPKDKIVFDVSHQVYPHKMLTGRQAGFTDPIDPKITGYSNPQESEHDFFVVGHTSTSLSLATGMAKARDLQKEKYNVIALIGDGSLSGGEALEGLSNGAVLGSNFIVILNDNDMSIAPVNGGLFKNLSQLRETKGQAENNIFKAMGYDYVYVDEGNDVEKLIAAFKQVKDSPKPVVVHIHTLKGKGFKPAEENKEFYHWLLPGFLDENANSAPQETYNSITADYLLNKKKTTPNLIAVSPATPGATGFTPDFREKMGKNYVDVDIAEQHAVGFISGAAKNGAKPVLAVMSSFIQRSYDQLSQDLALNNAPATILVFAGTISAMDMTHLGIFDIPLISNIPNIVYLAPTNKEEYLAMTDWAIEQDKYPVAIRVPVGEVVSSGVKDKTDYSKINTFKMTHKGEKVALIGEGNFYRLALDVQKELKSKLNIDATVINPVYLSGIDEKMLEDLKQNHSIVITLEDGCLDGGFGEKISRFYGNSAMKVLNYGAKKEFTDRIPLEELYKRYRLTKELIREDVETLLK